MYWTLELAYRLEDAPWPATKEELIDYATRSGAPRILKNWRMTARFMKVSKISGPTIPQRTISFSTRRNISAFLSTETAIKSLSINKIGRDLICLDNGVLPPQKAWFVWIKSNFGRENRDLFGQISLPLQRFVSIATTAVFYFKQYSIWEDLNDYIH